MWSTRTKVNSLRSEFEALIQSNVPSAQWAEALNSFRVGSIKVLDAQAIAEVLKAHRPKHILEIGCFVGFSSRWMLEVSKEWNPNVVGIDPSPIHPVLGDPKQYLEAFVIKKFPQRFRLLPQAFDESFRPANASDRFDLVFIDGDHSYEAVKRDFEVARRWLSPNGVILFHDALSWPDVDRYLKDLRRTLSRGENLLIHGRSFFWFPRLLRSGFQAMMKAAPSAASVHANQTIPVANAQGLGIRKSILYDLWFDGVAEYTQGR